MVVSRPAVTAHVSGVADSDCMKRKARDCTDCEECWVPEWQFYLTEPMFNSSPKMRGCL